MIGYLAALLRGLLLRRDGAHHGRSEAPHITIDQPVPVQTDGDPAGHTPVEVRTARRAILHDILEFRARVLATRGIRCRPEVTRTAA